MSGRARRTRPPNRARRSPRDSGMIHQELRLLPDLSVAENIFVGR